MGKLSGGILGPVKGKVGAVVGSVSGGQNVVRSMPASYSDKNSQAQQTQRTSFKATLEWYQVLASAILGGYPERKAKVSAYNSFMSDNVNKSITAQGVDWPTLKISKGSLGGPGFTATANANDNEMVFNWADDTDGSSKLATDEVVLVVVEPNSKTVHVSDSAFTRSAGTATVQVPTIMQGQIVQTFAYIKRADGKKASVSKYTGWTELGSEMAGNLQG